MQQKYFRLARSEEQSGNLSAALIFYVSDFCSHFNRNATALPFGTVNKIRHIQNTLSVSTVGLLEIVKSYGSLSDDTCKTLLLRAIDGDISGIREALSEYGGVPCRHSN